MIDGIAIPANQASLLVHHAVVPMFWRRRQAVRIAARRSTD
jgi:hypothetical protein